MIGLPEVLAFTGGFIADLLRKLLLPQSEAWLGRFLPHSRRSQNLQANLLQLDVRKKLEELGYDPDLANQIEDDSVEFAKKLRTSNAALTSAYVETEAEGLAAQLRTQAEMNEFAYNSLQSAESVLGRRYEELMQSEKLSPAALEALRSSQQAWEKFRRADAELEGLLLVEGGSMQPMITAGAMEAETLERIARLAVLRGYSDNPEATYFNA